MEILCQTRETYCRFREDDSEARDATPCQAALYRPFVSPAEEREDLDAGDSALYRQLFTDLM